MVPVVSPRAYRFRRAFTVGTSMSVLGGFFAAGLTAVAVAVWGGAHSRVDLPATPPSMLPLVPAVAIVILCVGLVLTGVSATRAARRGPAGRAAVDRPIVAQRWGEVESS